MFAAERNDRWLNNPNILSRSFVSRPPGRIFWRIERRRLRRIYLARDRNRSNLHPRLAVIRTALNPCRPGFMRLERCPTHDRAVFHHQRLRAYRPQQPSRQSLVLGPRLTLVVAVHPARSPLSRRWPHLVIKP